MSEFNKRKTLYFKNQNLYEFMEKESEEMGLSISGYINMLVSSRKQQLEAMKSVNSMGEILKQIQTMTDGQMNIEKFISNKDEEK